MHFRWWIGRPGVLRFMGSQRVGHNWATDLIWSDQLSGASILCFQSWVSSGLTVGNGWSLMAAREGILSFPSSLRAHRLTISSGYNRWWLWHPCLLIWQEIPIHYVCLPGRRNSKDDNDITIMEMLILVIMKMMMMILIIVLRRTR